MRVGFIGLGTMGGNAARNIMRRGSRLRRGFGAHEGYGGQVGLVDILCQRSWDTTVGFAFNRHAG